MMRLEVVLLAASEPFELELRALEVLLPALTFAVVQVLHWQVAV